MSSTKTKRRQPMPQPPPQPRLAVGAPPVTDPEGVATKGDAVVAAVEADPATYGTPPTITPLKTSLAVLRPAIVAAVGGSDAQQAALLAATMKTRGLISQHGAWIQGNANNLPPADAASYITKSGFSLKKVGQRTSRTAPELSNNGTGGIRYDVPPVARAVMWFAEVSLDGGKNYVRSTDTETLKGEITGLPSGQVVWVRLRPFIRGSGYGPWIELHIMVL